MAAHLETRLGNLELRSHKPQVGSSSLPTATKSTEGKRLASESHGIPSVARNRYYLGENIAILLCPASNGKVFAVTIDKEDLDRVLAVGMWRIANFDRANGRVNLYCYCKSHGQHIYLHRFILNAPKDRRIEVDHTHHRNMDNRKSEIVLTTKSENQKNKRSRDVSRAAWLPGVTSMSGRGNPSRRPA